MGFVEVGQKGSHIRLKRETGGTKRIVIVPNHAEITPGTLGSIIRQSGLSKEEFIRLIR
ncbi:MAG: type II toxin-antitoxin system HicA family toxin [Thermoplasmatota archaeon]